MKLFRLEFICVGSELLTGKINTHTAYLGQRLASLGLSISREHAVGDNPRLMRETFSEVLSRSNVVICAGGLGPTFDDITRDVWAAVLNRKLVHQPWLLEDIKKKFRSRGVVMPPMNRRQTFVLEGARVIPNNCGTAPGQILKFRNKWLILLPGPSRELVPMVENNVLPHLQNECAANPLRQKSLLIFGVPESTVDQMIRPWVARRKDFMGCRVTHGILASQAIITVKFSVSGKSSIQVEKTADRLEKEARKILGRLVFGTGQETLEGIVGELLRKKNKTLAVAESCTGGLISKLLTDVAGSSDYFAEGVVTYTNQSKMKRLGVKTSTLARVGAVSPEVAKEMVLGLRKSSGATYGLSVTGVAGPSGGSLQKPVGLVFIGVSGPRGTKIEKHQFRGDRASIRHRAALTALNSLRETLLP
ncbi:MAG: putative competence-damage inducible protein [Elusimicrobia bacterium]|nr:putative competence-damage inducible protein [Elusimicrobiota bacterium]